MNVTIKFAALASLLCAWALQAGKAMRKQLAAISGAAALTVSDTRIAA